MTSLTPPVRNWDDGSDVVRADQLVPDEDRPAGIPAAALEIPEPEVTLPGHRIHVVLDDGAEWTVRADNRDFLRWDKTAPRHKWDARTQPFLLQTFLAWAASRRQGLTELSFDAFGDVCLEARDVKDEADDEARPTR